MTEGEPDGPAARALGRKRVAWTVVRVAVLTYAGLCLYACAAAGRMIFQPQPSSYSDGPDILKVPTADGETISALHLANPDAEFTVLHSHGNAEDLGTVLPFLQALRAQDFAVFAYDYRCYGTSEGKPSERKAYRDVEAAYDYLVGEVGVPPERIIAHGRSLGGGPACYIAAEREVGGLVLESSFVSAFRVVTRIPLLPFDRFKNLRKIAKADCPVLVIHGTADRVVPAWHGRKLFGRAREPKRHLELPGAGHNDPVWLERPEYWDAWEELAATVGSRRPSEG